jgi:beta-galactosidase
VTARPSPLDALDPWQAPELTGAGRLPPRADFGSFATAADALAGRAERTLSLDGTWRFRLVARPGLTPRHFADPDFDERGFGPISVPGDWTMQGHGRPHYTNVRLPFAPAEPPCVPPDDPTGLYRTRFALPAAFGGLRLVLELGGVETAFAAWLNGVPLGVGKDARLPSAFDVTAAARPGENVLAVQVVQWADSSYVEDQDHWRQAGIYRSVTLHATPHVHLADVACRAGYDHVRGRGALAVVVRCGGLPGPGYGVRVALHDGRGRPVLRRPLEAELPHGLVGKTARVDAQAGVEATIARVAPWSAESPALYRVVVTLLDEAGRELEATAVRVGFRSVEIAGRELRVNGRMVYLRGANRHEHDDVRGKAVDAATALADVRVLKAFNFNAVRCSHYPPDTAFLDLCDEHGLYVVDEADVEAHHHYETVAHDPRYALALLDRALRMAWRDRNHPSVIAWSLGNESGYGPAHDAMAAYLRHLDPTRVVQYEGAISRVSSDWDRGHAATDVVCPMYPPIADIVEWAQATHGERPLVMCEYAHAMGNSCGGLADYWEAIEAHHGLQGGFIWELLDQGIRLVTCDGTPYWGYGGDFGDVPNDANFCCDGLVWPDRTPHPAMWEARHVFRPIAVEPLDLADRRVLVRSRRDFTTTTDLAATWHLARDGREVARGPLDLPALAPGAAVAVRVPCPQPRLGAGEEAHLTLRFRLRRATPLLPRGHEVAVAQFALPDRGPAPAPHARVVRTAALAVRDEAEALVVSGPRLELRLTRESGRVAALTADGVERLLAGPRVCAWRAPTDNDAIRLVDLGPEPNERKAGGRWARAGLDRLAFAVGELSARTLRDGRVRIDARIEARGADPALPIVDRQRIVVGADGTLAAKHALTVPRGLPDLARIGVELELPDAFEALEWFGRGPHESYVDRCAGAAVGRYAGTVTGTYVPYVMPQEHGNLTGLRWLAVRAADGSGLLASIDGTCEGKATRYPDAVLAAARHTIDVAPADRVHLHLDARQRGLGTASCGPDTLARYLVPAGTTYRLSYRLVPLRAGDDAGSAHRGAS